MSCCSKAWVYPIGGGDYVYSTLVKGFEADAEEKAMKWILENGLNPADYHIYSEDVTNKYA